MCKINIIWALIMTRVLRMRHCLVFMFCMMEVYGDFIDALCYCFSSNSFIFMWTCGDICNIIHVNFLILYINSPHLELTLNNISFLFKFETGGSLVSQRRDTYMVTGLKLFKLL